MTLSAEAINYAQCAGYSAYHTHFNFEIFAIEVGMGVCVGLWGSGVVLRGWMGRGFQQA